MQAIFSARYRPAMLTNDKLQVDLQSSRHHSQSSVSENATVSSRRGLLRLGVDSWVDGQGPPPAVPATIRWRADTVSIVPGPTPLNQCRPFPSVHSSRAVVTLTSARMHPNVTALPVSYTIERFCPLCHYAASAYVLTAYKKDDRFFCSNRAAYTRQFT